jgi:hypothetical protein
MKFQLRGILIVVVLTALLFTPLAKPSQYWLMLLPAFATVFVTVVVAKASKGSESVFWKAMPSGAFAYLFLVQFIGYFIGTDPYRGRNVWNDTIGLPFFKLLHGESAFLSNRQGLLDHDLLSFYVWMHVVAAVVLSTIIAFIGQLAVGGKRDV